jgi:hypothetical protein
MEYPKAATAIKGRFFKNPICIDRPTQLAEELREQRVYLKCRL